MDTLLAELPGKNAKVCHDGSGACGKVVKLHPLAGTVDVQTDQGPLYGVPAAELRRDGPAAPGRPPEPEAEA